MMAFFLCELFRRKKMRKEYIEERFEQQQKRKLRQKQTGTKRNIDKKKQRQKISDTIMVSFFLCGFF